MTAASTRLGRAFAAARGRTGLIPFITAGYPSLEQSLEILRGLEGCGARAVEIGIPFSDPIADGPEIQRASEHALRQGVGVEQVLQLVRDLRRDSQLPVVLMTYANPIFRFDPERFAECAAESGVDGVLVSDLPPEEAPEAWDALDRHGLDTVVLVAPTTAPARLPRLLDRARGFVYCLARTGVTGRAAGDAGSLPERVAAIRAHTTLPIAVGFGISSPDQARELRGLADAVVVGAALMHAVADGSPEQAPERVLLLASRLASAIGRGD